jgi:transcriptional regulator with XRE-family HTH domain
MQKHKILLYKFVTLCYYPSMSIGERLENLIKSKNTNVYQVAMKANVSPQTIYSIIRRNNTKVDLDVLQDIADELGVTLDYFKKNDDVVPIAEKGNELAPNEEKLLIPFRKLNDAGQKKTIEHAWLLHNSKEYRADPPMVKELDITPQQNTTFDPNLKAARPSTWEDTDDDV